jgi:hypothetical protein
MDHVVDHVVEQMRKNKPRRMMTRRRKPVGLQEEWGTDYRTDYMFLNFSK